ncbi:bifunctional 2-C-methyl-D-erythritol 4-phosphate cytidylyltransferase/2-C-methyl-D-erythritol 2,4-cyclodiphosphate synthase [Brevundimonas sp.]|uniref:bifunctional 2-C-methyl-D-erythritol 4-phosphate cytidylyltransferase/2-C-methyl-D-erythritol 2,4-cyclodiphosphate synthase n=1 Tax=Brevundimonas sp. TaxID=1871086 RepID=UPI003BAD322B
MTFAGIVVAAGTGSRAGGAKQWRQLGGKPIVRWSVEALLQAGAAPVVVVIPSGAQDQLAEALSGLSGWAAVSGGETRALSVQAGLAALTGPADQIVLIHDAARPMLTGPVIDRLLNALTDADGAIPALPVPDTLKRGHGGAITDTVDRAELWRAQTPQAFRADRLARAWANWPGDEAPTDDAAVVERDGGRVALVQGDARLMKLTFPEDFAMAEALIAQTTPRMQTRVGTGFDVHRWGPGTSVWLCGVEIAHDQTLIGHSDADAGLHALTDAILGALGDGDIGDHFPPTDPKWKGAASDQFLIHAVERVAARGGRVVHVDVTLICEQPKVKPHRLAMRERLAAILNLPLDAVSVKATTTEALGFTGRGEGLAAQAAATVELPA